VAPTPANPCETVTTTDLSVLASGTRAINTDGGECTRIKTQLGFSPEICVMVFRNITFDTGSTLTVSGSRALALVATASMTLKGVIDVSANGWVGGPGAASFVPGTGANGTGLPDAGEMTPGNAGGGGGGFGMAGAKGGDDVTSGPCTMNTAPCVKPGDGGLVQGLTSIIPLRSGSGGGFNSANWGSTRQGFPGGGGGALQLVSCASMTIANTALIDANGGGGQGGRPGASATPGAGAGGGSGGAILLEAQTMTLSVGIQLFANGGGGGGGATLSASGGDGEDGPRDRSAAKGGLPASGGSGSSFAGGTGGAANNAGTPVPAGAGGGPVADPTIAAGGGGGGVGRIRLNDTSAALSGASLLASPVQTVGTIAACADTANPTGPCLR
jgi:hypothetical protein